MIYNYFFQIQGRSLQRFPHYKRNVFQDTVHNLPIDNNNAPV